MFSNNTPGTLAYVEWFGTPPKQHDSVNGMFPISRSRNSSGVQQYGIVELVDIRRGCQLIPKFGQNAVDRSLTPLTIMEQCDLFYLNNRLDKESYRSIHWEASDDEDDE